MASIREALLHFTDDLKAKDIYNSDAKVDYMIQDAVMNFDSAEEQLTDHIDMLQRRLSEARERITNGEQVNSLGVVQNSGSEVDRLCALRAEKAQQVTKLLYLRDNS